MKAKDVKSNVAIHHIVKKQKNQSSALVEKLHSSAFLITTISASVMDLYLYPLLEQFVRPVLTIVIVGVIDAFLYAFWYFFSKIIHHFVVFKTSKKAYDLEGEWYHVHIPLLMDGTRDFSKKKLRAGTTKIVRDLYDFTFSGINYNYELIDGVLVNSSNKPETMTSWHSDGCFQMSDKNEYDLIQIYKAQTPSITRLETCPCCKRELDSSIIISESEKYRRGIHKFKLHTNDRGACVMIDGEFSDCWPSLKKGNLLLFRDKNERDNYICDFFFEQQQSIGESVYKA